MAQLKNKKHEIWAIAIVDGKGTMEAQALAGYRKNSSNASNFMRKHPEVEARINELLKIKEDAAIARREECAKILTKMARAGDDKTDTVKQKAIELLAKLQGWLIERVVTENKISSMTDTELEKILQEAGNKELNG
jgi:pyrroloquinoline quinone (PQQ) biosynthesis protein C